MIVLTHSLTDEQPCYVSHVWPYRVVASDKVFVFYRDKKDAYYEDRFWNVASASDLETMPEDSPAPEGSFFLTDTVTFHARSEEERDMLKGFIVDAIDNLNLDLTALESAQAETYDSSTMITLTKQSVDFSDVAGQHVWPLTITAASTEETLSDKIFVFHASMEDDMYIGDLFEAVASVQQMQEIPEDSPGVDVNGELVPYYRKASVTFYARTPAEADDLWDAIIEDVDDLTRNWAIETNTEATHTSTGD